MKKISNVFCMLHAAFSLLFSPAQPRYSVVGFKPNICTITSTAQWRLRPPSQPPQLSSLHSRCSMLPRLRSFQALPTTLSLSNLKQMKPLSPMTLKVPCTLLRRPRINSLHERSRAAGSVARTSSRSAGTRSDPGTMSNHRRGRWTGCARGRKAMSRSDALPRSVFSSHHL